MIAVLKIPEKEPWCSATEFRAREITIGHITEANSPIAGKAITETLAGPNKAADKRSAAGEAVKIDWATALKPRGIETRLGECLRELISNERAQPLSAVVVFNAVREGMKYDGALAVAGASSTWSVLQ